MEEFSDERIMLNAGNQMAAYIYLCKDCKTAFTGITEFAQHKLTHSSGGQKHIEQIFKDKMTSQPDCCEALDLSAKKYSYAKKSVIQNKELSRIKFSALAPLPPNFVVFVMLTRLPIREEPIDLSQRATSHQAHRSGEKVKQVFPQTNKPVASKKKMLSGLTIEPIYSITESRAFFSTKRPSQAAQNFASRKRLKVDEPPSSLYSGSNVYKQPTLQKTVDSPKHFLNNSSENISQDTKIEATQSPLQNSATFSNKISTLGPHRHRSKLSYSGKNSEFSTAFCRMLSSSTAQGSNSWVYNPLSLNSGSSLEHSNRQLNNANSQHSDDESFTQSPKNDNSQNFNDVSDQSSPQIHSSWKSVLENNSRKMHIRRKRRGAKWSARKMHEARHLECVHCHKMWASAKALHIHMARIHGSAKETDCAKPAKYKCDLCPYSSLQMSTLNLHSTRHIKQSTHKCTKCTCSFPTLGSLRRHTNGVHHTTQGKLQNQISGNPKQANAVGGPDFVRCAICNKNILYHRMTTHRKEAHPEVRPYYCTECPYTSVRYADLWYHKQCHTKQNPHQCSSCSASFTTLRLVYRHTQQEHPGTPTLLLPIKRKTDIVAKHDTIGSGTAKRSKSGLKKREHKCNFCSKIYFLNAHIARHLKTHKMAPKCSKCSKRFNDEFDLADHINAAHSHTQRTSSKFDAAQITRKRFILQKPIAIPCQICGVSVAGGNKLNLHYKIYHPKFQFYKCNECPFKTAKRQNLWSHKTIHSFTNVFKCAFCTASFSSLKKQLLHTEEVHSGPPEEHLTQTNAHQVPCTQRNALEVPHTQRSAIEVPYTLRKALEVPYTQGNALEVHHTQRKALEVPYTQRKTLEVPLTKRNASEVPLAKKRGLKVPLIPTNANGHSEVPISSSSESTAPNKRLCRVCEEQCSSRRTLEAHFAQIHPGRMPYFCSACPFECVSYVSLYQHRKLHFTKNKFECKFCTANFTTLLRKSNHVRGVHAHTSKNSAWACISSKIELRKGIKLKKHSEIAGKIMLVNEVAKTELEDARELEGIVFEDATKLKRTAFEEETEFKANVYEEQTEFKTEANKGEMEFETKVYEEEIELDITVHENDTELKKRVLKEETKFEEKELEETELEKHMLGEEAELQIARSEEETEIKRLAVVHETELKMRAFAEETELRRRALQAETELKRSVLKAETELKRSVLKSETELKRSVLKAETELKRTLLEEEAELLGMVVEETELETPEMEQETVKRELQNGSALEETLELEAGTKICERKFEETLNSVAVHQEGTHGESADLESMEISHHNTQDTILEISNVRSEFEFSTDVSVPENIKNTHYPCTE